MRSDLATGCGGGSGFCGISEQAGRQRIVEADDNDSDVELTTTGTVDNPVVNVANESERTQDLGNDVVALDNLADDIKEEDKDVDLVLSENVGR